MMNDPTMNQHSETAASQAPRTRWRRVLKWSLTTLIALTLLIAIVLGVFTFIMARTPAYRAQVQSWLSERAKLDIQFDGLSAGWRVYGPELVFTRAVVRSSDHQHVLARAERGGVGFDLWKAFSTGRLSSLRFTLQGTELKMQRRADGEFEFVGQEDWPEFNSNSAFKLDSLPVGQLVVRDARLSFRDQKTGRGPWVLNAVELEILRQPRVFDLNGSAALPANLGKEFNFSAHGEGNLNDVAQLKWRAQLAGTEFDLAGWHQVMPDDWIAPAQGQGSFQFQVALQGKQLQRASGRLDFVNVQMALPRWTTPLPQADALQVPSDDPDAEAAHPEASSVAPAPATNHVVIAPTVALRDAALTYRTIALQFNSTRSKQGWLTQFERLQFARDDSPWPNSTAMLLLKFNTEEHGPWLTGVQAKVQLLVLDNIWPLLAYLPETTTNAKLRALNASGRLSNVAIDYERDDQQEPRYGMRAEFAQLGVSPVGRTPGINGLSGVISATGARGEVTLDSRDLTLNMPSVFRTPLPADQLSGNLHWTRTSQGTQLQSNNLSVANSDGALQARFTLDLPRDGTSPIIDLHANLSNLQAAAAPRYMPAGVMHKHLLEWLDGAFSTGMVKTADATLRGPLNKFPFRGEEGLFLIKAQIEGLALDYQRGWLPASDLRIDAEFRNVGFNAVVTAGRVNDLQIDHAEGGIKDYRQAELVINAKTHGDLGKGLMLVQQSPVGPSIGTIFQSLSGTGTLKAAADMYFPMKDLSRRKLDIRAELQNGQVTMSGMPQGIEQLEGSLRILNDAVVGADLRGRFLQSDFVAKTEVATRGRYNIVAMGQVQAPTASEFLKLPAWIKLDGAFNYRYTMPGFAQREADGTRHLFSVDSDLRGLAINLPAPVYKPAANSRNLHVEADLRGNDMMLRGELGTLRALVKLQPGNQPGNEAWRFDRAGLRADGIAAALPAQPGLRVDGRIDAFTLDDWLKLDTGHATVANAANSSVTNTVHVQDILRAANVNIDRLRLFGFEFPAVRGLLQATDAGWRIDVAGAQAAGQVLVPYDFTTGRVLTADMDTLHLTPIENSTPDTQRHGSTDPRDLPSLRADIKHFIFGEHDFGALQLAGTRTPQGLQVGNLHVSGDSFNGTGTGSWLQASSGQQNTLKFTLESTDVRATLQQFNYGDLIAAKRGKLIANLTWPDGLDAELLGRTSGTLEFQIDEGQLLTVQPGAGRVLGLLSIAALPRRLGLDFRDVTDKGLAFDNIHADFTVQHGDARTQNLLLRGPTAEIGMVGRMGLGARDYDQTAVVTGNVGSALPVAGTVAGGPVVGAALLLFSQIFKEPLKGVARAYYHIGGSWEDPQIERIDSDAGKASLSGADSSVAP